MSIFSEEKNDVVEDQSTASNVSDASSGVDAAGVQPQPFADLLGTVLNEEGKPKYSNVPEAIKGLSHAQEHIRNLEQEAKRLKEELDKRQAVEDALQQVTQSKPADEQPRQVGLDEEAVAALVEQRLQSIEQSKVSKTNTEKVVQALQQKFGDKAEESFYKRASEVGLTREMANSLAAQSPDAILALFNTTTPSASVSTSSVNTAGLQTPQKTIPTIMDGGEERINLPRGERSLLMGATNKDLMEEFNRHKAAVYSKYNLTP